MNEERWGDVRDWKDWRERQAALIADEICKRNQGVWPLTVEEWQAAAAHYGLHLYVTRGVSAPAETHDNVISVRYTFRVGVLGRRICHEIAEAIAKREGALRQFNFVSPNDEHHHVARLVEQNVKTFVAKQARTSEKRSLKIEAEIRRLQEMLQEERGRQLAAEMQME